MLRQTSLCLKNPYVFKYDVSAYTTQVKKMMNKQFVHKRKWEPTVLFNPKRLAHADVYIDHYTYEAKHDPHRANNTFLVPCQHEKFVPIPSDYKDAYWWRDLIARRLQCPTQWVKHDMYNARRRQFTDFSNLSFEKKFKYRKSQVVSHMKKDLR